MCVQEEHIKVFLDEHLPQGRLMPIARCERRAPPLKLLKINECISTICTRNLRFKESCKLHGTSAPPSIVSTRSSERLDFAGSTSAWTNRASPDCATSQSICTSCDSACSCDILGTSLGFKFELFCCEGLRNL